MWSEKNFVLKNNFGPKKNVCLKKMLVWKKNWSKKFFGPKENNLVKKTILVKTNLGPEKKCGFWSETIILSEKKF